MSEQVHAGPSDLSRPNSNMCHQCGQELDSAEHIESCGNRVSIIPISMPSALEDVPFSISVDITTSPPTIAIIPQPEQPIDHSRGIVQHSYVSPASSGKDDVTYVGSTKKKQRGKLNVVTEPASTTTSINHSQRTPPPEDTGNKSTEPAPEPTLRRSKRQRTEPRRL